MTMSTSESTNQKNQNKSNIKYKKKEEIPLKPSEKPQIGVAFNQLTSQSLLTKILKIRKVSEI